MPILGTTNAAAVDNWQDRSAISGSLPVQFAPAGRVLLGLSGTTSAVYSDNNGISWAAISTFLQIDFRSIIYGANVFVAIGSSIAGPDVFYSYNGISWSQASINLRIGIHYYHPDAVAFGNGYFILVAGPDPGLEGLTPVSFRSDNGISWYQYGAFPVRSTVPFDATYGGGRFVTVGAGFEYSSADGATWVGVQAPGTINFFTSVAYGNGIFVAVSLDRASSGPSNFCIISTDGGLSWVQRTLPVSGAFTGVAYGNGVWVITAIPIIFYGGIRGVLFSTDLINWTQRPLDSFITRNGAPFIVFNGNVFVLITTVNSSAVLTSTDGNTWTTRTLPVSQRWGVLAAAI